MSNIRSEIEAAAISFADAIFQILRRHSIEDLATEVAPPTEGRRRPKAERPATSRRASAPAAPARGKKPSARRAARGDGDETAGLAQRVVDFVAKNGESGRKAILEGTGAAPEDLQKALAHARGHGALALRGEKRNARYVATGKSLG